MTTTLAPHARVGAWRIVRLIARGGMGEVYEAENTITSARRALKVIRDAHLADDDTRVRFIREATLATQLKHPHVVEVWDPFFEGSLVVLPMELLEGETLASRIAAAQTQKSPMSFESIVDIASSIASGVGAFHALGLIHRDLKPVNIFLAQTGDREVVKVLDFGTVRAVHGQRHTGSGLVIGSPTYMAPEQAMGASDLDARVDVYALGVMLYEMVAGRRPYETDEHGNALSKLISGHTFAPIASLRASTPQALERVITRALARDRNGRFASMNELTLALQEARAHIAAEPQRDSMTGKPMPAPLASNEEATVLEPAPPLHLAEVAAEAPHSDEPLPQLPVHRSRALVFGGLMLVFAVALLAVVAVLSFRNDAEVQATEPSRLEVDVGLPDAGAPDAATLDAAIAPSPDAARTRRATQRETTNPGLWLDPH